MRKYSTFSLIESVLPTVVQAAPSLDYYMWVYVGLQTCAIITLVLSILTLELMCLNAAKHLHSSMLATLLRAPMR